MREWSRWRSFFFQGDFSRPWVYGDEGATEKSFLFEFICLSWVSFSIRETFLDHGITATSTEIGEREGKAVRGQGG